MIIIPPPAIKAVCLKTAGFVAKNGRAMEQKIASSSQGQSAKFAFLLSSNPFNAYYNERIAFYQSGGVEGEEPSKADSDSDTEEKKDDPSSSSSSSSPNPNSNSNPLPPSTTTTTSTSTQQATNLAQSNPVSHALLTQRTLMLESSDLQNLVPAPLHFAPVPPPPSATPLEITLIKLSASYSALHRSSSTSGGSSFLTLLNRKEHSNEGFAFLKPTHGHFNYFTSLVDSYSRVVDAANGNGNDNDNDKNIEEQSDTEEIDNNLSSLSLPNTKITTPTSFLNLAASRTEYRQAMNIKEAARLAEQNDADGEGLGLTVEDGSGFVDWHDFAIVETIVFTAQEIAATMGKTAAKTGAEDMNTQESDSDDDDDDDEMEAQAEAPPSNLNIVSDYTPKLGSEKSAVSAEFDTRLIMDPISKQLVPLGSLTEHMRIQLMDTQTWNKQTKKFQAKQSETNFADGANIASNLSSFSRGRTGQSDSEPAPAKKVTSGATSAPANFDAEAHRREFEEKDKRRREVIERLDNAGKKRGAEEMSAAAPLTFNPPPSRDATGETSARRVSNLPAWMQNAGGDGAAAANSAVASAAAEQQPEAKKPKFEQPSAVAAMMAAQKQAAQKPAFNPSDPDAINADEDETVTTAAGYDFSAMTDAEYIAEIGSEEITLTVILIPDPGAPDAYKLDGRAITIDKVELKGNVKGFKGEITELTGIPANKYQLRKGGEKVFLKDGSSVASNRFKSGATIHLIAKTRGGRK